MLDIFLGLIVLSVPANNNSSNQTHSCFHWLVILFDLFVINFIRKHYFIWANKKQADAALFVVTIRCQTCVKQY